MTLRQKRVAFTRLVARLIDKAFELGFEPAGDGWKRDQFTADEYARRGIGIANSLHNNGLALDLILYDRHGSYLTKPEHYRILGEWWEAQSTDKFECCWGGRFGESPPGAGNGRDGNHFSVSHWGRK